MADWDVATSDEWSVESNARPKPADIAPVRQQIEHGLRAAKAKRAAGSFTDAMEAGLQISVSGLAKRGEAPDIVLGEQAPLSQRAGFLLGQTAGDVPAMVAGSMLGGGIGAPTGPGALVTSTAGAFALPAGLRAVMMDAYEKGDFQSFGDFWKRTMGILWETGKGWITGAATGGAGAATKAFLPAVAPSVIKATAPTAAELTTMVAVGNALEGQLPSPQDFVDAAIVLGGVKAAGGTAAKLRRIYAETGKKPAEVVQDAASDPSLWQEVLATEGNLPASYAALSEKGASLIEANKPKTPVLSEGQAATALAYAEQPFARVPQMPDEPARPTHLNYNFAATPEAAKETLSRLSDLYEAKIQEQRRGTVEWKQTFDESAKVLADLVSATPEQVKAFVDRKPGTAAGAADLYARKDMALSSAENLMNARNALAEKGPNASPQEIADFMLQVETTGKMVSGFLGARAEAGRALNILKATTRQAKAAETVARILDEYGGQEKVTDLIQKLGEYNDPKQLLKFSQEVVKATTYEKVMEAYRAGMVSGLRTHEVNALSNSVFAALRIPKQAIASLFGSMREGKDKVQLAESVAMSVGMLKGTFDGFKVAAAELKGAVKAVAGKGEATTDFTKSEARRPAIEGKLGEAIRLPFRALSAEDAIFRTLNERGEAAALATRQAINEGVPLFSKGFAERVNDIMQNQTPEFQEAVQKAGERFTFNSRLGEKGRSFQNFVRTNNLEWMFPFIRTPGNIFKETLRMVPGLNLAIKEWRDDYMAGGAKRDLALAEVTLGGAMMSAVFAGVFNGTITGGGTPEKNQRTALRAAGWKPYAVKVGNNYYDGYLRMAPVGPLMGIAADSAEFWNYMTEDEHDKWARMLAFAFAQNITNQTFMRGFTSAVNVVQDPERYGESYFEGLAGSAVPGFIGQFAADQDPYVREIHGMVEAMRARIPYMRQGLMPKRDLFGDPIKSPEYLWVGSPFSVSGLSTDKVRTEAAKIGFAAPMIPTKVDVIPGLDAGKSDKIELTPEQRDVFASESGQLAHTILKPMVESPGWDQMPSILKRQMYERAFSAARNYGQMRALSAQERTEAVEKSLERFRKELQK